MGSTKEVKTVEQSKQTVAPPSWTMPGIQEASGRVTAALDEVKNLPKYEGPFVAQPDAALTRQAQDAYLGAADATTGAANTMAGSIRGLQDVGPVKTGRYDLGGSYDVNPAIEAATRPIMRQLMEQALPGLRSSALESGAYTGDRAMSVVPGQIISQSVRDAQDVGAKIGLEDYTAREGRRLAAYQGDEANALNAGQYNNTFDLNRAQLLPDLLDSQMKMLAGRGDLTRAAIGLGTDAETAAIQDKQAAYDNNLKYPFRGLDIASALLSQLSGNYGTTESNGTSTQTTKTGGLGSVVQGLAGLAGMVGSFAMPGGGSLGGNLLGSLFKKGS